MLRAPSFYRAYTIQCQVWIHSHYYAKGGQKKKALTALSKHARGGVSVHEVPEVQKINACTSRINVKLEFYRDHDEQFDPLLRTVEEAFMCQAWRPCILCAWAGRLALALNLKV